MQVGRDLRLRVPVEEGAGDDEHHDGHHEPAEPDRLPEQLNRADGGMLPRDESSDRLDREVAADREQRDARDEVADLRMSICSETGVSL
ncbi:hypothetical protein GCM10010213_26380 [Microbacterium maritypicum]|uniref:Uncharacterized protein n=1 Tax=Microbacterium maritypicum TaxID=33918 RepID=A0A4Y4B8X9_MICMQ|nr:hypothetical protein MLI01_31760 [Microbacterium liquefaciens]GGV62131.1 hypothetical protein GCM10010213_26380 [Microbacterium liquefaciens]